MSFVAFAIPEPVLKELRLVDDAGRTVAGFPDQEGDLPLRCCLRRSRAGERIALVSYAPLKRWARERGVDPGAYVEVGPVFIHAEPCSGPSDADDLLTNRRVFRAYDGSGRILGGKLVEPRGAEEAARELFADARVELIHVRAVEYGCFLFEIRR